MVPSQQSFGYEQEESTPMPVTGSAFRIPFFVGPGPGMWSF